MTATACPPTTTWKNYAQERPTTAGIYLWRVPSLAVPGLVLTFLASMRERGAGLSNVLSPSFDYWNGSQVVVPKNTQWQEVENPPENKNERILELKIDGVTHAACPFCKKVPTLHAHQSGYAGGGGGVVMSWEPHRYNTFWLECCSFGKTPAYADPRELAKFRNEALGALNHDR